MLPANGRSDLLNARRFHRRICIAIYMHTRAQMYMYMYIRWVHIYVHTCGYIYPRAYLANQHSGHRRDYVANYGTLAIQSALYAYLFTGSPVARRRAL